GSPARRRPSPPLRFGPAVRSTAPFRWAERRRTIRWLRWSAPEPALRPLASREAQEDKERGGSGPESLRIIAMLTCTYFCPSYLTASCGHSCEGHLSLERVKTLPDVLPVGVAREALSKI